MNHLEEEHSSRGKEIPGPGKEIPGLENEFPGLAEKVTPRFQILWKALCIESFHPHADKVGGFVRPFIISCWLKSVKQLHLMPLVVNYHGRRTVARRSVCEWRSHRTKNTSSVKETRHSLLLKESRALLSSLICIV